MTDLVIATCRVKDCDRPMFDDGVCLQHYAERQQFAAELRARDIWGEDPVENLDEVHDL